MILLPQNCILSTLGQKLKYNFFFICVVFLFVVTITESVPTKPITGTVDNSNNSSNYDEIILQHLELFHYAEDLHVLGPTVFPKPTNVFRTRTRKNNNDNNNNVENDDDDDDENIEYVPYLKPIHGKHRSDKDAIVAFAAEYQMLNYLSFIESLRLSGFDGDVILSISTLDVQKEDVYTYLTNADDNTGNDSGMKIILYNPTLTCYNAENEQVDSFKGGTRVCYGHEFYAAVHNNNNENVQEQQPKPLQDPRSPRTVQTLRYELYWIMCQAYNPYSWIFVIDARDSVFQSNPFEHVPRRQQQSTSTTNNNKKESGGGLIYMFGENIDATRLGQSTSNRRWLQAAYGDKVGTETLANKPTICSGATMGEWIAMETYLRAMVAEADHTGVVLAGADQGFHNYLHYSHKLKHATSTISAIVIFDQGQGIVNNMGALRTKSLDQWGNGQLLKISGTGTNHQYIVQNWDGTPSSVVHQFDRHKELSNYFFKQRASIYAHEWQEKLQVIHTTTKKITTTNQEQNHNKNIRGNTATQ